VRNVVPVITSVTGPTEPIAKGGSATITANFTDVGTLDGHTCTFDWEEDPPVANTTVTAAGTGSGSCTASHSYATAGVYGVTVTVTDDDTGTATLRYMYVVVYDPNAGFVTGGGWINSPAGAYLADPSLTGKANFGFVSKYKNGASTPTGETEFQFKAGNFNFHSSLYDWLVVSGSMAQYKGKGEVNGVAGYSFLLTSTDGQLSGGGGIDKFRIKVMNSLGVVVYDNMLGLADDMVPGNGQAVAGGSIVIHK
jgi:hypothetical protein